MVYSGKQAGSAVEWSFDENRKTLTIAGSGCMGDVLITESYIDDKGKERQRTVRKAPWDEFSDRVERIDVLPDVVTIAPAAFFDFNALIECRMPGIVVIGNGAFYLCGSLEIVQMPNVQIIGSSAFERCEKLARILVWQEGEKKQGYVKRTRMSLRKVMSIGNYAFANAKALKAISMEQCASVGKFSFYGCDSLEEALFSNASQLGAGVFRGCGKLTKVKLLEGCTVGKDAFAKAGTDEIEYVSEEDGD